MEAFFFYSVLQVRENAETAIIFSGQAAKPPVKTCLTAGMAGSSRLLHLKEKCIAVTIDARGDNSLSVSRYSALMPQLLTAAAIKPCFSRFNRYGKGFFIHIGYHEHLTAFAFLDDGGDKASLIKAYGFDPDKFHLNFHPSPGNSFCSQILL